MCKMRELFDVEISFQETTLWQCKNFVLTTTGFKVGNSSFIVQMWLLRSKIWKNIVIRNVSLMKKCIQFILFKIWDSSLTKGFNSGAIQDCVLKRLDLLTVILSWQAVFDLLEVPGGYAL